MSRTYFANESWCWAKQKNKDPIQENGHGGIKVFFAEPHKDHVILWDLKDEKGHITR
jgi:hypothetical protein